MKKSVFSIIMLLTCSFAQAQEKVHTAVVNVENDYKPVVVQVNKKNFTPTVESETNVTPLELKFQKQATPFDRFTSERNLKELLPKQESAHPGYARLGYGTGGWVDAKVAYKLKTGENGNMKMVAALDGFNTEIDGEFRNWDSRMYRTLFDADYTHEFEYLTLNVVGNFNNRVFNYHSTGDEVGITDKQNNKNYTLATKGTGKLTGPFSYTFNAAYSHNRRAYTVGNNEYIAQNHINGGGTIAYEIFDFELYNIGAEVNLDAYIYNSTLRKAANGYKNLFSADINPFLNFRFDNWKLFLGTKMNLRTNGGAAIAIAPNIKVEGNIAEKVSLYTSITGGRVNNGFEQLDAISPYWSFDKSSSYQFKPTYKVADFAAGARVGIEPLSFDFYAGYAYTKDDLLQTVSYSTIFNHDALQFVDFGQQNTHNIYVGARVGCDLFGWLELAGNARYDHWNCDDKDYLVMKPQFFASIEAEAEPIEGLVAKAGYSLTRYTAGRTNGRIGNKYSLDARVSYRIDKRFGAFVQGENLLNCKYYEFAGYMARGIRAMAGVTVDF